MQKSRILPNRKKVYTKAGILVQNKTIHVSLIVAVLTSASGGVLAAGTSLYEQATPDVGTASAGRYANAQNAGTVLTNPAGMTHLDGKQLLMGYQLYMPTVEFDVEDSTYDGGDGGSAVQMEHVPALYYTQSLGDDLKLGLAIGSYFGGSIDYDDDWTGRYHVQADKIYTDGIFPGIAYRVNEWLSVGGTLNILSSELDLKRAVIGNDLIAPDEGDGVIHFVDNDTGYGATISALIEAGDNTKIGFSYMSEIKLVYSDIPYVSDQSAVLRLFSILYNMNSQDADGIYYLAGAMDTELEVTVTIPQQLMISIFHDLSDGFAVMGNLGWQDYSRFGIVEYNAPGLGPEGKLTDDRHLKDTWHFALGAQWQYSPKWRWSAGIAYDTSPVDATYRKAEIPLDRQIRLASGVEYAWQEHIDLGVAYAYVDFGDAEIRQDNQRMKGRLFGEYSDYYMHVLSFNIIYKF